MDIIELEDLVEQPREQYLARYTADELARVLGSIDCPDVNEDSRHPLTHNGVYIGGCDLRMSMEVPGRMVLESIMRNKSHCDWAARKIDDLGDGWFRVSYVKSI